MRFNGCLLIKSKNTQIDVAIAALLTTLYQPTVKEEIAIEDEWKEFLAATKGDASKVEGYNLYLLLSALIKEEKKSEAVFIALMVANQTPNNALAWYEVGNALFRQEDFVAAIDAYDKAGGLADYAIFKNQSKSWQYHLFRLCNEIAVASAKAHIALGHFEQAQNILHFCLDSMLGAYHDFDSDLVKEAEKEIQDILREAIEKQEQSNTC